MGWKKQGTLTVQMRDRSPNDLMRALQMVLRRSFCLCGFTTARTRLFLTSEGTRLQESATRSAGYHLKGFANCRSTRAKSNSNPNRQPTSGFQRILTPNCCTSLLKASTGYLLMGIAGELALAVVFVYAPPLQALL